MLNIKGEAEITLDLEQFFNEHIGEIFEILDECYGDLVLPDEIEFTHIVKGIAHFAGKIDEEIC